MLQSLNVRSRHRLTLIALGLIAVFVVIASGLAIGFFARSNANSKTNSQSTALKILINENGMYELKADDLKGTLLEKLQDGSQLQLTSQGRIQPLWVVGRGKDMRLHFYGQASKSIYTIENVYWLERKSSRQGLPQSQSTAPETGKEDVPYPRSMHLPESMPIGSYFALQHLEQNKLYSPQVEAGDHWLWVSIPAPQSQSVEANLTAVADGSGRLRILMWASTEAQTSPDHHIVLSVNGQKVADETWDGKGHHLLEADLPPGTLKEGANTLQILAPGDTGVDADINFLDWVEIGYARRFVPENDSLDILSQGGQETLQGFSGPVSIYDVTNPEQADQVGSDSVILDGQGEHHYLIVGPQGYHRPIRLEAADLNIDLKSKENGADYVAIGPADLLPALQPLLDFRASQGLKVMAVPLNAVYDQFNGGLPEPEALRAFMKYAVENWRPAPRLLLLLGDATYDPRGYLSTPAANRLPVFLVPTVFGGETASDVGFAVLNGPSWPSADDNGDAKPVLAVGRVPAQTPEQVTTLVNKTLTYEKNLQKGGQSGSSADWQQRIMAVADGQEITFRTDAQNFLDLFPKQYATELIAPLAGASGVNQQLIERLNQGDRLVAYFGHGSVNMWGKDRLLTTEDVKSLRNGERLPIMLNMTCLNGLFTHPKVQSMAEALLWQPDGGAVAVLAPTSLTLPTDQSFLSRPLIQALLNENGITLGEALLEARRQVPIDNPGSRDVMRTFLLFGDPALSLAPFQP